MVLISKSVLEKLAKDKDLMISLLETEDHQNKMGLDTVGRGMVRRCLRHLKGVAPIIAEMLAGIKTITDIVRFFWP